MLVSQSKSEKIIGPGCCVASTFDDMFKTLPKSDDRFSLLWSACAFSLCHVCGFDDEAVATVFGVSTGSLRMDLSRFAEKLRGCEFPLTTKPNREVDPVDEIARQVDNGGFEELDDIRDRFRRYGFEFDKLQNRHN